MRGMTFDTDEGALCPFCGAAWSGAMLAQLDRATVPSGCACCGDAPPARDGRPASPPEDIRCAACGRAIYRAVAPAVGEAK